MTYEEFKETIEKTGEYQVSDTYIPGVAVYKKEDILCLITKTRPFGINTIYAENEDFFQEHLDTIIEFAKTPIEDRYPVKKYYVKPVLPDFINARHIYLNRDTYTWNDPGIDYTLDTRFQNSDYQTQFTMEEIEDIIPKEDMDKFQFIPVKED